MPVFMGESLYTPQFLKYIETIFDVENAWKSALQPVQVLDGVTNRRMAFTVKTSDTPIVFNTYNTGANVAFGTGTSNSSRFGPRTEILYEDTDVLYDYNLSWDDGIDRHTINANFNDAVARQLEKRALALVDEMNTRVGTLLGGRAGNPVTIASVNEANIIDAFSAIRAFNINNKVIVGVDAFVSPAVYNQLLKSDLMTTKKNSTTNIDTGEVQMAFGFRIFEAPDTYFASGDVAYFVPMGALIPFVGIVTDRIIEPEDFDGIAHQGAIKGGTYIADPIADVISAIRI
jgi:hypothetical protein